MGLYERLTRDDPVRPVDLIFVMAGRMERKHYGLELFRRGVSPKLVLSVGRFEVSRMHSLSLEGIDELMALREQTPPAERHFFVEVRKSGTLIEKAPLPVWNTYGEALGLRKFLETEDARRVMIISTGIHLRRVAVAFGKAFRGTRIEFLYCATPFRPAGRRFMFKEMIKLAGYRVILLMPPKVVLWIMQLKYGRFGPGPGRLALTNVHRKKKSF
jgi:hypothetical protein